VKITVRIAVCTTSLFLALPLLAQGNNSDHSGHDNDGRSAGHRQDAPHGFGDGNVVLSTPAQTAAVSNAVTSVTSALRSGSLTMSSGAIIPATGQANTYAVMTSNGARSTSAAQLAAALSTAGPAASALVPTLVNGFSALRSRPAMLPSVVASYNDFTEVASPAFIAKPPAEFLAMRAVLARLTTAAADAK